MNSSASVPLMDALPWPHSDNNTCWLVCDSVETDGRFLLHSLATCTLKQAQKVYWLACGPWTSQLIATALKKMGCDAASLYLRDSFSGPLHIQSITVDIATKLEEHNDEFDVEVYIKELYRSIDTWIHQNADHGALIVIDDASALACLVGERLTFCLLQSLRALQARNNFNFILKCSQDYDMDMLQQEDTSKVRPGGSPNVDWVGAGGGTSNDAVLYVPWERSLVELADTIVNVEPLASGYSREAHGRLVVMDSSSFMTPIVLNYCCQDSAVSAIRLRGPGSSSK